MKWSVAFREYLEKPIFFKIFSAAVVPDHSGGPVPISKGVPF
jgi:hypothetical protein